MKEVSTRHLTQGLAHSWYPINSCFEDRINFTCGHRLGPGLARVCVCFAAWTHGLCAALHLGCSRWDPAANSGCVLFCPVPVSWAPVPGRFPELVLLPWGLAWCQSCLSLDGGSNDTSVLVSRQQRIERHQCPDPDKFSTGRPHPCPDSDQFPHRQPKSPSSPPGPGKPWLLLPSGGSLR